ncbi:PepSY-associated TM helix domain-containing protein [Vibrio sp. SCSIO 43136]|uniref:PepSY-associated TM helix domain-containing protein n=1 Tax=Vibrio sp. SCSIO 43136 TaxID=2819101 RepID=UPI00207559BC|nr:PepSY-associated TM helix domain-containing protein [Vibrio sp. SCSIO 43136]USD67270.1 PepSY domain-containing protein [Vibrio sp. SCSIO 43136]
MSSTIPQDLPSPSSPKGKKNLGKPHSKTKNKLTAGRIAFLIHSYIGLKLSIIFSIVLLSGAFAVFHEEIDWLLYAEKRVTPQSEKMNPGEVLDRLEDQLPGVGLSSFYTAADRERTAATALKSTPGGGFKVVHIDPYTGKYQGETNFLTVGSFIRVLHTNLFMPLIGRAFVNFFGVLCLIGLISGLIAYRRFWRKFFTLPKYRGVKFHRFLADLHKFVGLWSLWFVLIIGVSGSWWFYHNPLVLYKVAPAIMEPMPIDPALTKGDLKKLGEGIPKRLSSAEIATAVKAHDPEFEITLMVQPEHSGMAYRVRGTKHDLLTNRWDSSYYVHPFTGEIIGQRLMEEADALKRFDRAMEPLHYGTFGYSGWSDLLVKTIWFIFGMAMSLLAISGTVIYYKRTRSATTRLLPSTLTGKRRTLKKIWIVIRPWGGPMSVFKYLNWLFIIIMCIGINIGFKLQREGTANSGFQYQQQQVGEWRVTLNAVLGLLEKDLNPITPGRRTNINAYIEGDFSAIKFMYVDFKKPRTMRAPGFVVHGVTGNLHAHGTVPKELPDNAELWLTIEDWYGNYYQTSWPLLPDGVNTIDKRVAVIN